MRKKNQWASLIFYIIGVCCLLPGGVSAADAAESYPVLLGGTVKSAASAPVDGQLATLSLQGGRVVFHSGKNKQTLTNNEAVQNVWLYVDDKNIYALWWAKELDAKKLYIRSSDDGGETFAPEVLISSGGVLPQLVFANGGDGNISVAYVTEDFPGYQVYVNTSVDNGKSWQAEDFQLNKFYSQEGEVKGDPLTLLEEKPELRISSNALSPRLFYIGDDLVAVWQERQINEGKPYLKLVSRSAKKEASQAYVWGEETELYSKENGVPIEISAIASADKIYVFGFMPGEGVLAFGSADAGAGWEAYPAAPATNDLNSASWFRAVVTENDDRLLISYVALPQGGKEQVRIAALNADSGVWDADVVSFRNEGNNQLETKSTYVDLVRLDSGELVAVWEDYRYLMPVVMGSYSVDNGVEWSEPEPLTVPGKTVSKFPTLLKSDQLWVTFTYFQPDAELLTGNKDREFAAKPGDGHYLTFLKLREKGKKPGFPAIKTESSLSESKKAERLKKRVTEFWDLRVKGKYPESWLYFDPLYKEYFPRKSWVANQGKISYLGYKLTNVDISGLIGKVTGTVQFTIPQMLLGEDDLVESPPPQTSELYGRWGWFYDDWYFMPETMFDNRYDF